MHIIVPAYHADGRGVASAGEKAARKREKDVAEAEPSKSGQGEGKGCREIGQVRQGRGEIRLEGRERLGRRRG